MLERNGTNHDSKDSIRACRRASPNKTPLSVGERFGRLVVLANEPKDRFGRSIYLCRCDCGEEKVAVQSHLRTGFVVSCGCATRERIAEYGKQRRKHGHAHPERSPTYVTWRAMKLRCKGVRGSRGNKYYRDKGIRVCERWQTFENFLADMGVRPRGKSIDRIDNDKGYEPGNCRWATAKEQAVNRTQGKRRAR